MFESSTDYAISRGSKLNIMVDETGRAVLADFSLASLIPDQSTFPSTDVGSVPVQWMSITMRIRGGPVRWMSPELLEPRRYGLQKAQPTRESDCYALGMVVYEILSGCLPYGNDSSYVILLKVLDGERPEKPEGEAGRLFTDNIWEVMELCWKSKPSERAKARDVLLCLEEDSPDVDEDDGQSDTASIDSQYVLWFQFRFTLDESLSHDRSGAVMS